MMIESDFSKLFSTFLSIEHVVFVASFIVITAIIMFFLIKDLRRTEEEFKYKADAFKYFANVIISVFLGFFAAFMIYLLVSIFPISKYDFGTGFYDQANLIRKELTGTRIESIDIIRRDIWGEFFLVTIEYVDENGELKTLKLTLDTEDYIIETSSDDDFHVLFTASTDGNEVSSTLPDTIVFETPTLNETISK